MNELKVLWDSIPNKKSRQWKYVEERHAFFTACRHAGYTTVELAKITGFDHSTMSYANKMHSANLLLKSYRKHYEFYYSFYSVKTRKRTIQKQIDTLQDMLKAIEAREQEQKNYLATYA